MDEIVSFEEQLYRDMVDRRFKGNDPRSFNNRKPEHAAYLIGRFFDHATSTIRLYCGNLARAMNGVQMEGNGNPVTIPHFMVMDQKGYRIEVDTRKVIATAKVNDVSRRGMYPWADGGHAAFHDFREQIRSGQDRGAAYVSRELPRRARVSHRSTDGYFGGVAARYV